MESVNYSRPAPESWNQITAVAERVTANTGQEPPTAKAVLSVFGVAERLNNEELEDARYQGDGLVICGIARALSDPTIRRDLVKSGVPLMLSNRDEPGPLDSRGLLIENIQSTNAIFQEINEESARSLPRSIELAADVLSVEALIRQQRAQDYTHSSFFSSKDDFIESVRSGRVTAENVTTLTTTATTGFMRTALTKLWESKVARGEVSGELKYPDLPADYPYNSPLLTDVLGEQRFKDLNLHELAKHCATLRFDEFVTDLDKYIAVNGEGQLVYRREQQTPSRRLRLPKLLFKGSNNHIRIAVLHKRRLKCPAVFVKGADLLVPMMVDFVGDVTTATQAYAMEKMSIDFANLDEILDSPLVTR